MDNECKKRNKAWLNHTSIEVWWESNESMYGRLSMSSKKEGFNCSGRGSKLQHPEAVKENEVMKNAQE